MVSTKALFLLLTFSLPDTTAFNITHLQPLTLCTIRQQYSWTGNVRRAAAHPPSVINNHCVANCMLSFFALSCVPAFVFLSLAKLDNLEIYNCPVDFSIVQDSIEKQSLDLNKYGNVLLAIIALLSNGTIGRSPFSRWFIMECLTFLMYNMLYGTNFSWLRYDSWWYKSSHGFSDKTDPDVVRL